MFYVQVWERSNSIGQKVQLCGNSHGQGFFTQYKSIKSFKRYVLENSKHQLNRVYVQDEKYFIKVYFCTEETKYQDEDKMPLMFSNE